MIAVARALHIEQKYADVGVRRMRRTGGHGRPPRACAEQGLRSAMPQQAHH
jgi:hypothetical protein